ncbi:DUF3800 domain-containing protein [Limnoraphis robusta Tam1]|uniref:DUF3800 domain-containing protein n=1 Tax=Limnoraphis robusta TaxID=1118279 RepID=UPI002B210CDE|nr:DUF3800 domain-containing protein [Limnoraphis robusta]MEA5499833.1 DUF3800 domain-containing protein [Limnoraphis robusta BA-68 BA1]MEA5538681.1 DUF3800 domain-containing protein [Limnoraphis robusta Tam1]
MILFYIDEGGTGWKDEQSEYFFLCALAIHSRFLREIETEFFNFKQSIVQSKQPDEWELKGRDIWQGLSQFKNVPQDYRVQIFVEFSQMLSQLPCHLFAIQMNKQLLREQQQAITNDTDLYKLSLHYLLNRLETFLENSEETGMLFLDSRSTLNTAVQDNRVIKAYKNWRDANIKAINLINLIGLPWFGFSAFYPGLQIVDYATYLLSRLSVEKSEARIIELNQAFNVIKNKIEIIQVPNEFK